MNADEILQIIEKFFEALKTVIAKLKEILGAVTGGNDDTTDEPTT